MILFFLLLSPSSALLLPVQSDRHPRAQAIYESFIRSALQYFSLSSLFDRVKTIFIQAKTLGHFLWGPNARIIAAACVYIVSRERNKALPLKDLAVRPFPSHGSLLFKN